MQFPADIPPGEYRMIVMVEEEATTSCEDPLAGLPLLDVQWPEGLSLRREDMYDDWGR